MLGKDRPVEIWSAAALTAGLWAPSNGVRTKILPIDASMPVSTLFTPRPAPLAPLPERRLGGLRLPSEWLSPHFGQLCVHAVLDRQRLTRAAHRGEREVYPSERRGCLAAGVVYARQWR